MGQIIDLSAYFEEPDIDSMDKDALRAYLKELRIRIEELDEKEPRNMNSEAYEDWADRHEELEDLLDDVIDKLEELEEE